MKTLEVQETLLNVFSFEKKILVLSENQRNLIYVLLAQPKPLNFFRILIEVYKKIISQKTEVHPIAEAFMDFKASNQEKAKRKKKKISNETDFSKILSLKKPREFESECRKFASKIGIESLPGNHTLKKELNQLIEKKLVAIVTSQRGNEYVIEPEFFQEWNLQRIKIRSLIAEKKLDESVLTEFSKDIWQIPRIRFPII